MNAEEKIGTGVEGLDTMLGGGIPKNHAVLILGFCGTGKTTLSMQFIWEGLKHNESGVIISLEESEPAILRAAARYGWDFKRYIDSKKIAVIKIDPTDIKAASTYIKHDLYKLLKNFKAQRVVIDPISLYEMMFKDPDEKRTHIFNLCSLIKSSGATALFISETEGEKQLTSRDGLLEYAMDGVILLRYIESPDLTTVKLVARIVKMRMTEHSRDIKPYEITGEGMVVHADATVY